MKKKQEQHERAVTSQNGDDVEQYDDGSIADVGNSRYLAQADAEDEPRLTIRGVIKENVAALEKEPDVKHVVLFEETKKGLVLNKTNSEKIAEIAGSGKFRRWKGVVIELWRNPTVTNRGKVTGGIRVRFPSPPSRPKQTPPHRPVEMSELTSDELVDELDTEVAALTR